MSDYIPNPFNAEINGDLRIAIVAAEWNSRITDELTAGCKARLNEMGITDDFISVFRVPGAIELTFASAQLIESDAFDAIVAFGCVIRGETPHFDYVCQSVTQGITHLNADYDIPVIFGVLTVENEQQALDRIGGAHGHKGREAADAAVKMAAFVSQVKDI